jgi:iron(III) transport system permease protein
VRSATAATTEGDRDISEPLTIGAFEAVELGPAPPGPVGPRRPPAPRALVAASLVVAALFALPGVYVLWRAVELGADLGEVARDIRAPLWRTVQLAVLVAASTAAVGTGMAWLVVRTDVPLRGLLRLLAPLPLVFPSFVGAAAFVSGLAPDGLLRDLLELVGLDAPRRFRGLGPAWLVLTLFTYPYVYLPVAARLAVLRPELEESARLLGDRTWRVFVRVVVPQIRTAVFAGALLVFLYTTSDFGAVQLLGYDTLTRVVYATRLADRATSFAAAAALLALAVLVVTLEWRARGAAPPASTAAGRPNRPLRLGPWRLPAFAAAAAVVLLALVIPLASLGTWAWRGLDRGGDPLGALGTELRDLGDAAWNTAGLSVATAAVALAVVLPVAVLVGRHRSHLAGPLNAAIVAGYAVPGIVIALSLVFWTLNVPGFATLYQTVPLLVLAYVVHFGSQAMRAAEIAVAAVPDRLRESARLLGAGPVRRLATVDLPLMRPGLLAGGGLVLLSTVKELPATLLLAPAGLETLATRVWGSYEDGFFADAGLAAVVLLLVSGVLTWLLVLRRAHHLA